MNAREMGKELGATILNTKRYIVTLDNPYYPSVTYHDTFTEACKELDRRVAETELESGNIYNGCVSEILELKEFTR
jgi:hypothetical protein